jgi:hypothetical protein
MRPRQVSNSIYTPSILYGHTAGPSYCKRFFSSRPDSFVTKRSRRKRTDDQRARICHTISRRSEQRPCVESHSGPARADILAELICKASVLDGTSYSRPRGVGFGRWLSFQLANNVR